MVSTEVRELSTIKRSDRRWQMPVAAALASGLPLCVGAWFNRLDYGLVSALGGMVFLYLPTTALYHRMLLLMAASFAMTASYALGAISQFIPAFTIIVLTGISILVTMVCRFYRVPPPASLFFIMAAAIAAYTPATLDDIPLRVGLLAMGCLTACLIAFIYSLLMLRRIPVDPIQTPPPIQYGYVIFDSVVIGSFVGMSLAIAELLQMERAYWVPISCLAVIQGMSLRAVWSRQLHRIIGTGFGLLLSWALFMLPLNAWGIAIVIMLLSFVIETMIVRHYAFAAMFITPLTILLAEAAHFGTATSTPAFIIQARFYDTVLGCIVGLIGAVCIHHPPTRHALIRLIRKLIPVDLLMVKKKAP